MSRFLAHAPAGLLAALERREATIVLSWRENLRSFARVPGPGGEVFVRYSEDPDDLPRFEHEAAVREVVGHDGPLRTPPVLEQGRAGGSSGR